MSINYLFMHVVSAYPEVVAARALQESGNVGRVMETFTFPRSMHWQAVGSLFDFVR